MRKTSVYLPDPLKRRLAELANATGRSEADLVRQAIDDLCSNDGALERPTRPDPPVPGRLVAVGVGPGPAGMVTVDAMTALRRADRVVAPCTSLDAIGRAETIVRQATPDVAVERVEFVMHPDHDARAGALARACERITGLLADGNEVAFITLGDPNMYSTASTIAAGVTARRPDTPVEIVPGVMAFQALAASGRITLADEQQSLVVLAAGAPDAAMATELADPTRTVILYKGGGRIAEVAEDLERADRLDGATMGELIGMPGERIRPVADVRQGPSTYLTTVISPAVDGAGPVPGPVSDAARVADDQPTEVNQ